MWSGSGRVDYDVGEADLWPWTRVKGAAPAVKSTQASTWTCWMSCRTEARRRTGGIGIGGLARLKEVSEVGWLEGKGPGGFG